MGCRWSLSLMAPQGNYSVDPCSVTPLAMAQNSRGMHIFPLRLMVLGISQTASQGAFVVSSSPLECEFTQSAWEIMGTLQIHRLASPYKNTGLERGGEQSPYKIIVHIAYSLESISHEHKTRLVIKQCL